MVSLPSQGQIGYPPTMSTDAALGYPRMASQSAALAMAKSDAGEFVLARLEGSVAEGHAAPRKDQDQKAKVGCCPCCARATHITIPRRHRLGEFTWFDDRGPPLREVRGPLAPRRLAAREFPMDFGVMSRNWGRAVRRSNVTVLEPLVRTTPPEDPPHVHGIESVAKSQPDATVHDVFPSSVKAVPKEPDSAVPSSSAQAASNNTPLAKHYPPAPVSRDQRECYHVAEAKSISASREFSPQPAPPDFFSG